MSATMSVSVDSMARDVNTLEPMLTSMQNMDRAMQNMTLFDRLHA